MIDNVKRLYQNGNGKGALPNRKGGDMMTHEEFLKEYGTRWKAMFEMCVWNVPVMREWLRKEWKAVYDSIGINDIDGTPELWLQLAHHDAMTHIDIIFEGGEA